MAENNIILIISVNVKLRHVNSKEDLYGERKIKKKKDKQAQRSRNACWKSETNDCWLN